MEDIKFVMEDIKDVIQFRLKRSDEAFEEARLLANEGHFNGVVNRLYYSAFYAVSGLLLKDKLYSKRHSGLKTLFHEHIVKEKKIAKEVADVYNELFDWRHNADYKDFIFFSKEEVDPFLKEQKS